VSLSSRLFSTVALSLSLIASLACRGKPELAPGVAAPAVRAVDAAVIGGAAARGGGALTGRVPALAPRYRLLWRVTTGDLLPGPPLVVGDRIYAGTDSGHLASWRMSDGADFRSAAVGLGPIDAGLALVAGHLVGATLDGELFRFDPAASRLVWSRDMGGEIHCAPNLLTLNGATRVLWGDYRHRIFALDAATGDEVWTHVGTSTFNGTPAVSGGLVAAGNCDGRVYVLSGLDGELQRAIDTGAYVPGSVALADGVAYANNYAGEVLALDLARGAIVWRTSYAGQGLPGSPALTDDAVVVVSEDGRIVALDRAGGAVLWQRRYPTQLRVGPLTDGSRVLVAGMDGRLRILRAGDGEERWALQVGGPIRVEPVVSGAYVALVTDDGELAFLKAENSP
jgi:outer membrane protein assembly factor BamB